LYLKYSKYISFKSLNYQEYIRVLHVSNFTIDYAHPKQSGMTMRCLEALSTQTKVISNNPFLMRNSNFSEKNAIIFDGTKENDDVKKQFDQMCNLTPGKSHRKISDFINDLLNKN
jgi:methylphosphotriester-DNA--protein-cysteine methyltransferase